MSNHQEITDLAKALTGNEHLYSLQPFIKITGDPLLGLFLERVVYWSDKSSNSNLKQLKIFYKTAEEWEEELGLSYAQVTRARKTLESMGFIQTSKHKVAGAPTLHYYANVGAIKEAITLFYQSSSVDYANLNNSEIQESPNSENDSFQFEETVETIEIQESEHSSNNSNNSTDNSTKELTPKGVVGKPPAGAKTIIRDRFLELTGLSMPTSKGDISFWWANFGEILKLARGDPDLACRWEGETVSYMQASHLTITGPKSIVGLIGALASGQTLRKNGATHGTHQRGNKQTKGQLTGHDSKLRETIDYQTGERVLPDGTRIPIVNDTG